MVSLLATHAAVNTIVRFPSSHQETATAQPTPTSADSVWPFHVMRLLKQTSRRALTLTTVTSRRNTIWLQRLCSSSAVVSNVSTAKLTIPFQPTLPLMVVKISKAPVDKMTRRLKLPRMTAMVNRLVGIRFGLALVVGERTTMSCVSRRVASYSDAKRSMAQKHQALSVYVPSNPPFPPTHSWCRLS